MEASALAVYFTALVAVTAAPGPLIAVVVTRAMGQDRSGAVAFAAGVCAGDLIVVVLALAGLGLWAQSQPAMFVAAKYAGCAYLLWLAVRMWREPQGNLALAGSQLGIIGSVTAGLILCLSSPQTFMFYVVLLPGVIEVDSLGPAAAFTLMVVTLAAMGAVFGAAIALADQMRRLLTSPGHSAVFTRAMAALIAITALWFMAT